MSASAELRSSTRFCAVYGHPVRHSATPAMHNPALAARVVPEQTCVLALPWWREASDHRPVLVTFSLGADK